MRVKHLLFSALCIVILSCNQDENKTTESNRKDKELAEKGITAKDSAFVKSIIQELKGIEKFAVKEDFELLSSLLAFKGDSIKHAKLMSILEKKGELNYRSYHIEALDLRNGYIRYTPEQAEGTYTITYWNLDDGSKLIATEEWSCGPVCESYLSFEKYQNGIYESLENQKIIPGIEGLAKILIPNYVPGLEPYEFKYKLPKRGKNIRFCLNEKCVDLEWQNGIFKIKEE